MSTVNTPLIGTDIVTVTRTVKSDGTVNIWGPMTFAAARRAGHLGTHGGTVSVRIDCDDPAWHARCAKTEERAVAAWHRKHGIR